jgi:hypothetical protein
MGRGFGGLSILTRLLCAMKHLFPGDKSVRCELVRLLNSCNLSSESLTFWGFFSNHRLEMRSAASWQIRWPGSEGSILPYFQRLAEISGT